MPLLQPRQDRSPWQQLVLERGQFLLAFLFGALGIVISKWFGLAQLVATAIPVLVLCAYFTLVIISNNAHTVGSDEGVADSFYYLGLLYTLVSMGITLFQFEAYAHNAAHVVSNFGVAITTTIFGLFFRVFLLQLQPTLTETEERARQSLAEAAYRLRDELDHAVLEVKLFQEKLVSTTSEQTAAMVRQFSSMVETVTCDFQRAIVTSMEELPKEFARLSLNASRVSEAGSRTALASEQLAERLEAIQVDPDLLGRKIRPLVEQAEQQFARLASVLNDRIAAASDARASLLSTAEGLRELSTQSGQVKDRVREFTASIADAMKLLDGLSAVSTLASKASQSLISLSSEIESHAQSIQGYSGEVGAVVSVLTETRSSLSGEVAAIKGTVSDLQGSYGELAAGLRQEVQGLRTAISDHVTTAHRVRDTISALSMLERPLADLRERTVAATEGLVRLTTVLDGAASAREAQASPPNLRDRLLRRN